MGAKITYRHNVMPVNSIDTFLSIRGGFNHNLRDVYFVRGIGEPAGLVNLIDNIDKRMGAEMLHNRLKYVRITSLPQLKNINDCDFYSAIYDKWKNGLKISLKNINIGGNFENVVMAAYESVLTKYSKMKKNATDSMIRNFATKILFWLDQALGDTLSGWNESACIKVIADNVVKEQEYLFYFFLTLIGCDVLLIENRNDIMLSDEWKQYSYELKIGEFGDSILKKYIPYIPQNDSIQIPERNVVQAADSRASNMVKVKIPEKPGRASAVKQLNCNDSVAKITSSDMVHKNENQEKSLEELAQLASSVVLIAIHNRKGKIIGSGSGIMIGRKGYILTNNHVASGGRFYTVRIENDEKIYPTDEVIKYNPTIDLAVIRINRQLNPIPIYKGIKKLVRGQKVVAIGSPLGMFNSVSDGIISGFRNLDDVDMIQFTAPISHGSSGGAVLNMQGEVIGISTAGIDSGQNINLAIGYESILMFAQGFFDE